MKKHAFLLVSFWILSFHYLLMASPNPSPSHYTSYIDNNLKFALQYAKAKKIPVSICLAQAMHESAAGQSTLALRANNHFGIKAIDTTKWSGARFYIEDDDYDKNGKLTKSPFRKYNTIDDSFKDYAEFLSKNKRYQHLFKIPVEDYRSWANGLVVAGYATDPEYATYLIEKIEKYELYKYDLTTPEKPKIAVKNTPDIKKAEKKITKPATPSESYNLLASYKPEKSEVKKETQKIITKPATFSKENQKKEQIKDKSLVSPKIESPATPKISKNCSSAAPSVAPPCPEPVQKMQPMGSKPIFLSIELRDSTK
jgi:Mannosyl-glycoprotein endo-beta-N-acetylglucosaminidase